jgi:Ca-activated chloride channel family protein
MTFGHPELLPLVLLLPLLAALGVWAYARRRRRVAEALGDAALVERLGAGDLRRFPWLRLLLLSGAAAALGVAAADPRWGMRVADEVTRSLDMVVAVDVSKSMYATDLQPSRLEAERLLLRRLLRDLPGDRIGLVVFAGRAYVLSPLTVDHGALNLYVDALDPGIVSQGGSSVAAAITQATDLVRGNEESSGRRVIVLLTDGEAHEDRSDIEAAADRAARAEVAIFTVGVGSARGAPVPDRDPLTGQVAGYKQDENGEVVISRMDPDLLGSIAERTGGTFVRLDEPGAAGRVTQGLRGLDRTEGPAGRTVQLEERFAWFVALGLLLLAFDALRASPAHMASLRALGSVFRRRAQRSARASALLIVLLTNAGWGIGDVERGNRLYRAGRYAEAVEAYREALADGEDSPQLQYNLGTALLRLGRYDEAQSHLQRALSGVESEVQRRSFFNLGSRFLEEGRTRGSTTPPAELLASAIEAYKRALRLRPDDDDAKWNLELALREQEQQQQNQQDEESENQEEPQSGNESQDRGGQGGGQGSNDPSQNQPDSRPDQPGGEMSQDQADRILSAVEQDERELTREKLRKGQRRTPVRKDW